jgi:hypothetical protein
LLNSLVLSLDIAFFLLTVPLKGIAFVLVMQIIDTLVIANSPHDIISLPVAYLFDLPQMLHVQLVSHYLGNDASAFRVYHQSFHWLG